MVLLNQLQQFAFAHHGVGQIHPSKLHLSRMVDAQRLAEPIVKGSVVFEFESANRVSDPFNRIALAVCPIVHRVYAPSVTGSMVMSVHDSIKDGVAEIEVGRRHIDLRPQGFGSVGEFPLFHSSKEVKVFFNRAITIRAFATWLRQRSSVLSHLISVEVAHKGDPLANQLACPVVKLFEIVGSVQQFIPLEAEPIDVRFDRIDVLFAFLGRIRIIESKVAVSAIGFGQAEIKADAFGVPDVQIAIRLRRKSGVDRPASKFLFARKILFDLDFDEVFVGISTTVFTGVVHCFDSSLVRLVIGA